MDAFNIDYTARTTISDDRCSDSGVSSFRSTGSGDERSGSRSSALSSTDEQPLNLNRSPFNRSPLFVPDPSSLKVWRDPALVEAGIRHVSSVQHQSLLMSHQTAQAAASGQPPTSSIPPASLYAPVPSQVPSLIGQHPASRSLHSHLAPNLYTHSHHIPEMLWKSPYNLPPGGIPSSHLISPGGHHPEELIERERALMQERHTERMVSSIRERQNMEVREMEKMKEREKERAERDKQEREREEKERQEQALQNHFEKSLRQAAQQKREQWNPITGRPSQQPQSRGSNSEEDKKRTEQQELRDQRHLLSSRSDTKDNRYYGNVQQQRVSSIPNKNEYHPPPPAHSRITTTKQSEKMSSLHSAKTGGELNMFGYPAYHPQNAFAFVPASHESSKNKLSKSENSQNPSMMNEMKNSVIVKHVGEAAKNHHLEPRVSMSAQKMLNHHYMPMVPSSKGNMYEYRNPNQSPHHHRQLSSPHHHQRQSPHSQQQQQQQQQAVIYPSSSPKTSSNYQFMSSAPSSATYNSLSNSKPKVSSPAPHHIYGKPPTGILAPVVSRGVEHGGGAASVVQIQMNSLKPPPLPASVSPSPYQQVSQYHPPPPLVSTQMNNVPPPAHSRTTPSMERPYDRLYQGPSVPSGLSQPRSLHGTSPPIASAAPMSRTHQYVPNLSIPTGSSSVQTQPLDLGMSTKHIDNDSPSPKRKSTPPVVHSLDNRSSSPMMTMVDVHAKKRRLESPFQMNDALPPTSLITGTTLLNMTSKAGTLTATPPPPLLPPNNDSNVCPDLSLTPVEMTNVSVTRPNSAESVQTTALRTISDNSSVPVSTGSSGVSTNSGKESPSIKTTLAPSSVDSEKSNSPGPSKNSGNYPVRHLKKAWLQRHTGEDVEDTTGMIGSGSCVTLPMNINNTTNNNNSNSSSNGTNSSNNPSSTNKEQNNLVSSLHSIGSMAVNSISKPKNLANKNNNRKTIKEGLINGHPSDTNKGDDSSSSDQERGRKSPPKRKPPKVKRKKGGGAHKKPIDTEKKRKTSSTPILPSESGSDSDKDTGSEKDSDSGASTTVSTKKNQSGKEPRKRGRRPKLSKNDKGDEPRSKKTKEDSAQSPQPVQRDPFRKPPVSQLKKTGESFLQDGPCFEVAPKLAKCRECRWTPNQRSKNMPNIFCRFYAFRRLRYTKNGQLAIAGFSDPHKNSLEDDIKLWLPDPDNPPSDLDLETSRFLLKQVGDHFCDLLVQEKNAVNEHLSEDKTVAWKRVVQGVREMCDVCETTLFNYHWACGKCGFVVCLDCYKGRKNGTLKVWGEAGKDRDEFSWLLCTNRQAHEQEKLMLTQIIADNCLVKLGKMVHEIRELWNIEQFCGCSLSKEIKPNATNNVKCRDIVKSILSEKINGVKKEVEEKDENGDVKPNGVVKEEKDKSSPLTWLADVALSNEDRKREETSSEEDDEEIFSTLRELLIRPSHKPNGSRASSPSNNTTTKTTKKTKLDNLDEVLTSVIEENSPKTVTTEETKVEEEKCELKHFVRRYNWQIKGRVSLPIRIMTLTESKMLYPSVPHSWLCDGKLLRLSDPTHKDNYKIFQDQWKRGQPVIVSDVSRLLNKDLWNPESFSRDFGDEKNDLVNCMTGNLVPNQPMRKFWDGFDHFNKRLKDDRGNPMLLKLKDWPPGEDFAEMLPSRFQDLMDVLPLAEYTHRNGRLNLASRLPDCFVRPDLGPKMYNAYGSALHPSKGTTNLHLDISDAVNVMVYVGIPKDSDNDEHVKEAFRAIDEAGCDILTRRRVRDKGELPGALWHIYNAKDADKIRDLLNKVVVEKGGRLEPHHDPIHDQSCYLDSPLRERLYKEYGVEGYAIVQCLGDAVFIPAGAPHQVRNLHNCIKVAEDFVSPENVSHCFHLTQEFRDLSDTHSNHEDKLQIKNIIYHTVKDSLSTLNSILDKKIAKLETDNLETMEVKKENTTSDNNDAAA